MFFINHSVDAAYYCRRSGVGCLSVCLSVTSVSREITDRDAVWDVDSGGIKEPYIRWSPDPHTHMGNFEDEKGPAQDMPRHVRRSIYSNRHTMGKNRHGADYCY